METTAENKKKKRLPSYKYIFCPHSLSVKYTHTRATCVKCKNVAAFLLLPTNEEQKTREIIYDRQRQQQIYVIHVCCRKLSIFVRVPSVHLNKTIKFACILKLSIRSNRLNDWSTHPNTSADAEQFAPLQRSCRTGRGRGSVEISRIDKRLSCLRSVIKLWMGFVCRCAFRTQAALISVIGYFGLCDAQVLQTISVCVTAMHANWYSWMGWKLCSTSPLGVEGGGGVRMSELLERPIVAVFQGKMITAAVVPYSNGVY